MIEQLIFDEQIARFPAHTQRTVRAIFSPKVFCGVISAADAQALAAMLTISTDQFMLDLLTFAKQYATPPISKFTVGAICQGLSGALYCGANMEFGTQALNTTVHAEQAAVMNAWIEGEAGISTIAINGVPCGHCRQFLNELTTASQLQIILPDAPLVSLTTLLPNAFGPRDLGNDGGLMQREDHGLTLDDRAGDLAYDPTDDPTTLAALAMANRSYAPYSGCYAGVAIETESGRRYAAPYAENAAFNPSLSPLQGALIKMNLSGEGVEMIEKAVLVEVAETLCSQASATSTLLSSISPVDLIVVQAKAAH